jgi:hypothetical protein
MTKRYNDGKHNTIGMANAALHVTVLQITENSGMQKQQHQQQKKPKNSKPKEIYRFQH